VPGDRKVVGKSPLATPDTVCYNYPLIRPSHRGKENADSRHHDMRRSAQSRTLTRLGEASYLASFQKRTRDGHAEQRQFRLDAQTPPEGERLISPCRRFDIGTSACMKLSSQHLEFAGRRLRSAGKATLWLPARPIRASEIRMARSSPGVSKGCLTPEGRASCIWWPIALVGVQDAGFLAVTEIAW
jgi:hypothetical protein